MEETTRSTRGTQAIRSSLFVPLVLLVVSPLFVPLPVAGGPMFAQHGTSALKGCFCFSERCYINAAMRKTMLALCFAILAYAAGSRPASSAGVRPRIRAVTAFIEVDPNTYA